MQNLKQKKNQKNKIRSAFFDVIRGFSDFYLDGEVFYLKHPSYHEEVESQDIYDEQYKIAKNSGVFTEDEARQFVIDEGLWSKEKEERIDIVVSEIQLFNNNKRYLKLSNEIDLQNKEIEKLNKEYVALVSERGSLFGQTCETIADEKTFLDSSLRSLYRDRELTDKIFLAGYESIDMVDEADLVRIFTLSHGLLMSFNEKILQKIAISDFFQNYFSLCEDNIYHFYGKPIIALTYNQVRLASWGRSFKFLLSEYGEKVSVEELEDPIELLDFHYKQENEKKEREKNKQRGKKNSDSSGEFISYIGASPEENRALGDTGPKKADFWDKAAEKGGSLGAMDILEMQEGVKFKF